MKCEQMTTLLRAQNKLLESNFEGHSFSDSASEFLDVLDREFDVVSSLCLADRNSKTLIFAAAPNLTTDYQDGYTQITIAPESGPCMMSAHSESVVYLPHLISATVSNEFKELALNENLLSSWSTPIHSSKGLLIGIFTLYARDEFLDQAYAREIFQTISKTLSLLISKERENLMSLCQRMLDREEEFQLLAEFAPQMPFIADGVGNIIYYNQKFYDYVGRGDDICGWNWIDSSIHHPDDLDSTILKWKKAVASGTPYQAEYRLRRFDGEYRWHIGRALPVKDKNGKVIRWYGSNVDIHEQKSLANRLSLAISAVQLGFWDIDLLHEKMSWNQNLAELFGLQTEKLSGLFEDILAKIHPEDRNIFNSVLEHSLIMEDRFCIEFRVIPTKGMVRWIEYHGEVYYESGAAVKIVGALLDITAKKEATLALKNAKEAAVNANEAKSRFLANMSHEIRTPIGVILGYTELLQMGLASASEQGEYYDVISSSCKDLTHIIDDILDLSKVEAGRLELEAKPFSFEQCCLDIYELFKDVAKGKNLFFKFEKSEGTPAFLCSDVARIKQVLINLIGNALKFTHEGMVAVKVKAYVDHNEMAAISIDVADTGIGLSKEQISCLFQPFTQADSSTSRKFGGTGLGLALSKRLAHALGGDVEIISAALNEGSTFRFTFKAQVVAGVELAYKKPKCADVACELAGVKVLIAEDVEKNRFLIKKLLSQRGASIDLVTNGKEAIDSASCNRYDVILMDIQMPELGGREATRILRDSGYQRPIIALTAHAMVEERKMNMEAGCDDYLTKPIDIHKLVHTIRHYAMLA